MCKCSTFAARESGKPATSKARTGIRLDRFKAALPEIEQNAPIAVHCKSGYRSAIACSLLQRAGHNNIINVIGGFDAWQQAQLPTAVAAAVGA